VQPFECTWTPGSGKALSILARPRLSLASRERSSWTECKVRSLESIRHSPATSGRCNSWDLFYVTLGIGIPVRAVAGARDQA